MKFNLIGFNFPTKPNEYKHCVVHPAIRLIPNVQDNTYFCPQCGTPYLERDTSASERFAPEFGPQSNKTKIYTTKPAKKHYDEQGNEINDDTLLKDLARGSTRVISYHEYKSGEERVIRKRN